jgi:hypothetical protein
VVGVTQDNALAGAVDDRRRVEGQWVLLALELAHLTFDDSRSGFT